MFVLNLSCLNIPSFKSTIYIFHKIFEAKGEAFQETRMALYGPMVGEAPGTLDGAWAEVALPVKHPRENH